jgi:hypothetical protein
MKLILVLLVSLVAVSASPALAARDAWPLHPGSVGPRVAGWQWMISGHCPNRYAVRCGGKVKPTLHRYTAGVFGARTKAATVALRYRLGFPAKGQCGAKASKLVPEVGPWFWALLRGSRDAHGRLIATRPVCWIALAASRARVADVSKPTPLALSIRSWELAQVGTHETCGGSCNRGSVPGPGGWSVDRIEAAFGLRGLAWCEIFQELGFRIAGYSPIPFSSSPFAVIPSYREWAGKGWTGAVPQVGSLMVWLGDAGHIGYVADVDADSAGHLHGITTVEGNASDGVRIRHYPVPGSSLRLFANLPRVTH